LIIDSLQSLLQPVSDSVFVDGEKSGYILHRIVAVHFGETRIGMALAHLTRMRDRQGLQEPRVSVSGVARCARLEPRLKVYWPIYNPAAKLAVCRAISV
jgi:hypothetical protein